MSPATRKQQRIWQRTRVRRPIIERLEDYFLTLWRKRYMTASRAEQTAMANGYRGREIATAAVHCGISLVKAYRSQTSRQGLPRLPSDAQELAENPRLGSVRHQAGGKRSAPRRGVGSQEQPI